MCSGVSEISGSRASIRAKVWQVVLIGLALLTIGAATAMATSYGYFGASACCAARHASSKHVFETNNLSEVGDQQVVCVQEHVYPNWPSTSGSFFDGYKCDPGATGHSLNGANIDQAYCWVNGSSTLMNCFEDY